MKPKVPKVTPFMLFNPFRSFFDRADILRSARLLAVIALYLAVMDFARALGFWHLGIDVLSHKYEAFQFEWAVTFIAGLVLAWLMYARQPLWAGFIIVLWESADLALKTVGIATGHRPFGVAFLISFILMLWVMIFGTRANWQWHLLRKQELKVVS